MKAWRIYRRHVNNLYNAKKGKRVGVLGDFYGVFTPQFEDNVYIFMLKR